MSGSKNQVTRKTKILYIVFSIVSAIALWMYISYVDNPETTWPVRGIPIEFIGEDILQDKNLTISSVDIDRVNVTFGGRFSILSEIDSTNVTAVVDLSPIVTQYSSNPGSYQLKYTLDYDRSVSSNSVYVESANYDYVTVTVEKTVSATIPLKQPIFNGNIAEGFISEPMEMSTDYITVSGPQEIVSRVSYGVVTLNRENVSKSITEELSIALMDSDGNEVDMEKLVLSQDTVTVTMNILMVKEIPLTVNRSECESLNDSNTTVTITPSTIKLSGDPEILAGVPQLNLGTIDQTKFETSYNGTHQITIPNGTNNLTGETTAEVNIEVIGLETKRISATNIQPKDKTEGYEAEIITQSLDVTVRGKAEVLEQVTSENIRIVADFSSLGEATGTTKVPCKVYVDGVTGVDAVGDYSVNVNITQND